ncbi:MAG: hypothetical protein K5655_08675 [Lachnospiraceae bacterium]|nr:hypothetical protein [Lachnospiraceae bacterium]
MLGIYEWYYMDGEYMKGGCADSAHPLQVKKRVPKVVLASPTISSGSPNHVTLLWDIMPDKVSAVYRDEGCWGEPEKAGNPFTVELDTREYGVGYYEDYYEMNLREDHYIYEVKAEWHFADLPTCSARYSFCT